jgi:hypothetical protein
MNRQSQIAAASTKPAYPPVAGQRGSMPAIDRGAVAGQSLPQWASTPEARALLAAIAAEDPDRTKPLTETMTGETASFGYRGLNAARLRILFKPEFDRLLDWVGEAPFPSAEWDSRRQVVIQFERECGPEALIESALGAACVGCNRVVPLDDEGECRSCASPLDMPVSWSRISL